MHYKGEFANGMFDGKGLLTTKAGSYDGPFKTSKMHGQGLFQYVSGGLQHRL